MKSRILSFNIMLETMKKQIWVPALIILGFFLCLPVAGMISMGWLQADGRDHADMIRTYTEFLVGSNLPFYAMMTIGSAVLTGVSGFSWLHSRVKTDFYHSLPIRREKLFVNQLILNIAYFAVPYLLNLFLAYVVGLVYGVLQGYAVRVSLESFLFQFLFYLVIYFVVVLAMLLTGKLLPGVMGAVILTFYGPLLDMVLRGTASTFFSTYANQGLIFSRFLQGSSPVIKYYQMYTARTYPGLSGKSLLLCVLAAAALALLCFCLYRKRPSESAGRTMAFYRIGKVLQYLIELLVVLGFGIMFCNISAQAHTAWLIFGVLFGGVLSHGIMEMIQEGDIRRVMAHKRVLTVAVASSLAVFGICYWDVFRYDEFLPKQEELKAVSIRTDDGYSYENIEANEEMQKSMEQMASAPEVYDALEQILKTQVGWTSNGDGKWMRWKQRVSHNSQENVNIRYVRVKYVLEGGRTVHRKYLVDFDKSQQQLIALYDNLDYKKTIYPLAVMTEQELLNKIESGDITAIDDEVFELPGNQEMRAEFLKTYRAELLQLTSETIKRERPVGKIQLEASWGYYQSEDGQTMTNAEYMAIFNQEYYIYPSFTRTLALLERKGIELPEAFPAEFVENITVYDDAGQEKVIQDRKQIQEILPELTNIEVDDGIMSRTNDTVVDVKLKKDGYVTNITCTWTGDEESGKEK